MLISSITEKTIIIVLYIYINIRWSCTAECPSRVIILIINILLPIAVIILSLCIAYGVGTYIMCVKKPSATQYRWKETHSSDYNSAANIMYATTVVHKLTNRSRVLNELSFLSAGLNPLSYIHAFIYYAAHASVYTHIVNWVGTYFVLSDNYNVALVVILIVRINRCAVHEEKKTNRTK